MSTPAAQAMDDSAPTFPSDAQPAPEPTATPAAPAPQTPAAAATPADPNAPSFPSGTEEQPGGTGRITYESAEHARSGVGANITKALLRGVTGLPLEALSWAGLTGGKSVEQIYQEGGLARPKPEEDPARYREDDPHPVTTEITRGLESAGGEFLGGLATPVPGISELGEAASFAGRQLSKTGIPQALGKGAGKVGEALSQIPGVSQMRAVFPRTLPGKEDLPTAGMRTGQKWLQMFEANLAKLPGGGALVKAVGNLNEKYADTTRDIVGRLAGGGDVSATTAGGAIRRQIEQRRTTMQAEGEHLYGEVDRLVPPDTPVHMRNTISQLEQLTAVQEPIAQSAISGAPTAGAEHVTEAMTKGIGRFNEWLTALKKDVEEHGYLGYGTVKALRTEVGQEVDQGVFSSMPNAKMRRLYGAISDDMMNSAQRVGDEAFAAVNRANTRWKAIKEEQQVLQSVLDKHGGPENVFKSLIQSGTQTVWGGGASTIKSVLAAVDEPTRQLLAASTLHRLGRATKGLQETVEGDTFNANTFFTNWHALSQEARQALFYDLPGQYGQEMDRLARNVEALKQYARILPNPSGTTRTILGALQVENLIKGILFLNWHAVAGAAGSYMGVKMVSAALTNPQTVRYLARKTGDMLITAIKSTSAIRAAPDEESDQPPEPQPEISEFPR